MKTQPQKIYTAKQAAEILNVTPATIRNWIRWGKLNAELRLGKYARGAYFIHEIDLQQFLKEVEKKENRLTSTAKIRKTLQDEIDCLAMEVGMEDFNLDIDHCTRTARDLNTVKNLVTIATLYRDLYEEMLTSEQ